MTRLQRVPGEKPLFWIGSSQTDLLALLDGARKSELHLALHSLAESTKRKPEHCK